MQVANKITYYNKAMSAIVVNNDSGQDPLNKSRVQVYIPELHGMKDTYTKYQEYVAASDKPNRDDFTAYPWAFNTVSDVNNGDTVYVMNLSNYIGSFVVIGRDASCKSGTGGSDSDLSAGGLAELIIPFTIHHECYVHITDSSCHTEGYATVKGHDPLYKCVGWDSNIPDIVLAVYTTSTSGSWSVGLLNWDASRAYKLIFEIASRDSSWKSKFTNTNNSFVSHLERDVQTGNCSTSPEVYQTGRTSEPSIIKGIQAMLTSSMGREVQISTCRKDVTDYVQGFLDSGISNPAIVMYMADLCNQWGSASPFLEAMRSAAKDPSSIMGSVSKEVEIAIKNYPNANQMMKEVEAIHAYWMGPLHTKYGMNRYIASKDGVWKYLQLKIFPDLVYYRWRYAEDRYFKLNRRLWLKTIWWYAFLAWRKDEDYTKKILEGNTTDTILQLVERTGNYGYRVELYNEILFQKYNCNIKDQDIFRRILILNTMRVKIIDPYLYRDGISGYVKDLLIDSNAITKEEL